MHSRIDTAETTFLGSLTGSPQEQRRAAVQHAGAEAWRHGILHRVGDALFGWVARARARTELAALSDSELSDIGITRGDIDRVLHSPQDESRAVGRPFGADRGFSQA